MQFAAGVSAGVLDRPAEIVWISPTTQHLGGRRAVQREELVGQTSTGPRTSSLTADPADS